MTIRCTIYVEEETSPVSKDTRCPSRSKSPNRRPSEPQLRRQLLRSEAITNPTTATSNNCDTAYPSTTIRGSGIPSIGHCTESQQQEPHTTEADDNLQMPAGTPNDPINNSNTLTVPAWR